MKMFISKILSQVGNKMTLSLQKNMMRIFDILESRLPPIQ
jgi:hypothetical protein